jgi:hypothetical protein
VHDGVALAGADLQQQVHAAGDGGRGGTVSGRSQALKL